MVFMFLRLLLHFLIFITEYLINNNFYILKILKIGVNNKKNTFNLFLLNKKMFQFLSIFLLIKIYFKLKK